MSLQIIIRLQHQFMVSLSNRKDSVLLRISPVILRGDDIDVKTCAFFYKWSTCTLMDDELVKNVELDRSIVCFAFNGEIAHHEDSSKVVSVDIAEGNWKSSFY